MNNYIKYLFPLLFSLAVIHPAMAEEYRSFGNFTEHELKKMNETRANYNRCLHEFAQAQFGRQRDPRVIADHSMKHCAPILEGLHGYFVANDFAPGASRKFLNGVANRAANRLLSDLMLFMATTEQ